MSPSEAEGISAIREGTDDPAYRALLDRDFPAEVIDPWYELVKLRKRAGQPYPRIGADWTAGMYPMLGMEEHPLFTLGRSWKFALAPTVTVLLTGEVQDELLARAVELDRYFG